MGCIQNPKLKNNMRKSTKIIIFLISIISIGLLLFYIFQAPDTFPTSHHVPSVLTTKASITHQMTDNPPATTQIKLKKTSTLSATHPQKDKNYIVNCENKIEVDDEQTFKELKHKEDLFMEGLKNSSIPENKLTYILLDLQVIEGSKK